LLMIASPCGSHLSRMISAVCLAAQTFVPDRMGRVEEAVEDGPLGRNNSDHVVIIVAS
jgi:hypothetical protein